MIIEELVIYYTNLKSAHSDIDRRNRLTLIV